MENCLLISYEEIFIDNTGQKILEDYIGFKAKTSIMDRINNKMVTFLF